MAFQLNTKNEAVFQDKISGSEIVFYYRLPTVKERVGYQNAAVKRTRNELSFDIAQAQYKYGLKVLEGIREGDFEIPAADHDAVKNGKLQSEGREFLPVSSDKKSPYYMETWKEVISEHANHLVIALGNLVFGNPAEENQKKDGQDADSD